MISDLHFPAAEKIVLVQDNLSVRGDSAVGSQDLGISLSFAAATVAIIVDVESSGLNDEAHFGDNVVTRRVNTTQSHSLP